MCFYAQEDFNNKIDDIQEKLDHLKLELAKYNQSNGIKTKQIVRISDFEHDNSSCMHYPAYCKLWNTIAKSNVGVL